MPHIPNDKKITDDELIIILDSMENDAVKNKENFISANEESFRRVKGEPYGNEIDGRSSVVSNDAADVVNSDMPSLVRMFLSSNPIMKFKAVNPNNKEEVEEAEEKTKYIDWLIRGQMDSFRVQHGFLKDVDMFKMGVLKYMFEETESTEEHEWKGLSEEELVKTLESFNSRGVEQKEVEVISHDERIDVNGLPEFDIKVKVIVKRQEFKVIGIPTESFLITQNSADIDDAMLVGDTVSFTRGELLAQGVDKAIVRQLNSTGNDSSNVSTMQAIRFRDEGGLDQSSFKTWANQTVEISDLYVKIDFDGDGIAERRHIRKSGNFILDNEPFDHVPYAMASALLSSHKAIGEGRVEQVHKISAVKTALTRQMLDNGYMVTNPKMGVNDKVNIDEILSDKIGGIVRSEGSENPGQNIFPIVTPFIGDKSLLLIQHMDQIKAQMMGTQMASQGLNADQLSKETATRFKSVEEAAQAKLELVARVIVEVGYRKLYSGAAWMVSRFQNTEREFAVLGKALKSNPSNWKFDHQLNSEIGLGSGDNAKIVENMSGIWQITNQLKAQNSSLVDADKQYNVLTKLYKALEINDVSQFINDPKEPDELLKTQNEQLNTMVIQLQEQNQIMQQQIQANNQLADAEKINQQTDLIKAKDDSDFKRMELEEKQRQFNISTAQKGVKQDEDNALALTKLELDSNQNVPGSVV